MQPAARAQFPQARPRRLRRTEALRRMVRETRLSVDGLIYPVFVVPGADVQVEIQSMPGVYHQSVDRLVEDAREVADLGIPALLLFGLPPSKDWEGTGAWAHDGIVQQALRAVRRAVPSLVLIADTCLCEYTSHGHCGIPGPADRPGFIDNDRSLELLTRAAVHSAPRPATDAGGRVAAATRSHAAKSPGGYDGMTVPTSPRASSAER